MVLQVWLIDYTLQPLKGFICLLSWHRTPLEAIIKPNETDYHIISKNVDTMLKPIIYKISIWLTKFILKFIPWNHQLYTTSSILIKSSCLNRPETPTYILNKKIPTTLHFIWLTMWFNMHIICNMSFQSLTIFWTMHNNLCHDFFNDSPYFEPCTLICGMGFLVSHHTWIMHTNLWHDFFNESPYLNHAH
jgi:hypothetical protein